MKYLSRMFIYMFVIVICTVNVKGSAYTYTHQGLDELYKSCNKASRIVELEHDQTLWEYENYLDQYKVLEEGVDQLSKGLTALELMISQTMSSGVNAKEGETTRVTMTVGEIQDGASSGQGMDMEKVEIVDVHVDEETKNALLDEVENELPEEVKKALPEGWKEQIPFDEIKNIGESIPKDILDQIPEDIKDQIPVEAILQRQLSEATRNVEVTLAIDAKTYYLDMVLPELIEKKAAIKEAYDKIIKDNQLAIYIEMESLKIKKEYMNQIKEQADMKAQHEYERLKLDYEISQRKLEEIDLGLEVLREKIEDEKLRYKAGLSVVTVIQDLQSQRIDYKRQRSEVIEEMNIIMSSLKYLLDLEEGTINLELETLIPEPLAPMDENQFFGIVSHNNLDLRLLREQNRLYKGLEHLASQVYKEEDISYKLIMIESQMKAVEHGKQEKLLNVAIRNAYDQYESAYNVYKVEMGAYDIFATQLKNGEATYKAGRMSQREYDELMWQAARAEGRFLKAASAYMVAYHRYVENILGVVKMP